MRDKVGGVPFFSVVIPVYNGEKYIEQCVRSVLSQTFEDLEVVAVDDGSADSTGQILEGIAKEDERLRVLHPENGGVFRARAAGLLASRGTYVLFCDGDDELSSLKALEMLYESASSEEYDVIQYGYKKVFRHIRVADNTVKTPTVIEREEFYEREYPYLLSSRNIASRLMVNTVTKAYHRRLCESAPAPDALERLFMGDDMLLNLYLLEGCSRALYLPDCLYTSYRLRGSSSRYRREEMHNLNIIKAYQLSFLERWKGKDLQRVTYLHHFETADWLFVHMKNSIGALGREECAALLSEILSLPAFVRAREYFSERNEDALCVRLLVSGNVEEYLSEAKKNGTLPLKARIYKLIKEKIVYKI